MYEVFGLKKETQQEEIAGYRWNCADPSHVVCLIHGIGEYAGRYDRMADKMARAGIAMVSMDLRGHGKSFGKRGHCAPREKVFEDIDALLLYAKESYPEIPLVLYGHSMGGNIALHYRKQGKQNSLPAAYVISAPWVELVRKIPALLYLAARVLAKAAPSFAISSGVSSSDLGNPREVGNYGKDPLVHGKISALCAAEGFDIGNALASGSLKDNGGAKDAPMLLMHGTEDKICSISGSEKIAAAETCQFIKWPGLFHEIHNGGPESSGDEVIEKVITWIQEL